MKHTIEGCLILYNVPMINGRYFTPNAFKEVTGTHIPVATNFLLTEQESKIIGYAVLEHREDGVYYTVYLNDDKASDEMIEKVINCNYFLGMYTNQIKFDPENSNAMIDGKIRAMAFAAKCDNAACVLSVDGKTFDALKNENRISIVKTKEECIKWLEMFLKASMKPNVEDQNFMRSIIEYLKIR